MKHVRLSLYALGMALLFTTGAHAHDPQDRAGGGYAGSYDQSRVYGYRDGYRRGSSDRDSHFTYNFKDDEWKRGERGYRSELGPKGRYKKSYRDAYVQGYDDGYYSRRSSLYIELNGGRYWHSWDRDGDGDNDDHGRGSPQRDDVRFVNPTRDAAYDFGFRDGVYYAQRDVAAGRRADPDHCKGYKDADHGYDRRFNRDEFKRFYREAFIRGYNQQYFGR